MLRLYGWALLVSALLAACAPSSSPSPNPGGTVTAPLPPPARLTFMAGFKPQANLPFVAVYLADSQGYFKDENLEVDIQHAAGAAEHITLLAAGRVHVITATGADLVKRVGDAGIPLTAIALFGQRTDQAFVWLPSSGIQSPKDWEGRTVGYKGTPSADYLAILNALGVDRSRIREVSVGFDPRVLTEGRVDVYPVFESNEPYIIRKLGFEPRVVRAADYGITSLGLTLAASREWLATHPDLGERFLRAALRGARHAIDRPEDAIAEVMKRSPQEDPEHQRYMLAIERRNALEGLPSPERLGWMNREQWVRQVSLLRQFGVVTREVDPDTVFTLALLERIYAR